MNIDLVKTKFSKFENNKSLIFLDQIIVSGSNFLLGILLARFLGVEIYGKFALLWMIILFFSSLQLAFIIAPMLTLGAKKSGATKQIFLSTIFYLQLLFTIFLVGLLFCFFEIAVFIDTKWDVGDLKYYLVIVTCVFLIQDFLRRYFIIKLGYIDLLILDCIAYLVQFLILGYFIYFNELSLQVVFKTIIITFGISMAYGILRMKSYILNLKYLKLVLLKNWNFSKWLIYSAVLQWGSGNYFIVAAGVLLGTSAVGAIRVIQNIMGVFHVVFLALENILPISFSEIYSKDGIMVLMKKVKQYAVIGLFVFVVLGMFIYPFQSSIIEFIYGTEYNEYAYLLIFFLLIYLFIYLGMLMKNVIRTFEETKIIFYCYVVNLIFSLTTASYLITNFNIIGAVIGMLIIQIMMNVIMYIFIMRYQSRLIKM